MCTAHCAILTTLSPTHLVAFSIAPALPIILNISRSTPLAQLASWSCISIVCVHFNDALIPLTSGAFPIISAAIYSLFASPITLDDSRLSCSLFDLLAWYVDFVGSFQHHMHSHLLKHIPLPLKHISLHLAWSTTFPWSDSALVPPAWLGPYGLLVANLDMGLGVRWQG